jgi:hypothetical protein
MASKTETLAGSPQKPAKIIPNQPSPTVAGALKNAEK